MKESDELIRRLTRQYEQLLKDHWVDVWGCRSENGPAKASVAFKIDCQGQAYTLSSALSYCMRGKHGLREDFAPTLSAATNGHREQPERAPAHRLAA